MRSLTFLIFLVVSVPSIGAVVTLDFDQFEPQLASVGSVEIPDFEEGGFSIGDSGDGSFTAWGQLGLANRISGVELFTDQSASLVLEELDSSNFDVQSIYVVLFNGPLFNDYLDTTLLLKGIKSSGELVSQSFDLGDRFLDSILLTDTFKDLMQFEVMQLGGESSLQVASITVENSPLSTVVPLPPSIVFYATSLVGIAVFRKRA